MEDPVTRKIGEGTESKELKKKLNKKKRSSFRFTLVVGEISLCSYSTLRTEPEEEYDRFTRWEQLWLLGSSTLDGPMLVSRALYILTKLLHDICFSVKTGYYHFWKSLLFFSTQQQHVKLMNSPFPESLLISSALPDQQSDVFGALKGNSGILKPGPFVYICGCINDSHSSKVLDVVH